MAGLPKKRTLLPGWPAADLNIDVLDLAEMGQYEYPDPEECDRAKYDGPYSGQYGYESDEAEEEFDEAQRGWNDSPYKQDGCSEISLNRVYWYDDDMEIDMEKIDEEAYYDYPPLTKVAKAMRRDYYQYKADCNGGVKKKQTHIYEPWGRGTPPVLMEKNHNSGDLTRAPDRVYHLDSVTGLLYPKKGDTLKSKRYRKPLGRGLGSTPKKTQATTKPYKNPQLLVIETVLDPLLAKLDAERCSAPEQSTATEYSPTPESLHPTDCHTVPIPLPPCRPPPQMYGAIMRGLQFGTRAKHSKPKSRPQSQKLQEARTRRTLRNAQRLKYRGHEHRPFEASRLAMNRELPG